MPKSIEITCHSCYGLLRLVEIPKQDEGACPHCGNMINLRTYLPDFSTFQSQSLQTFIDDQYNDNNKPKEEVENTPSSSKALPIKKELNDEVPENLQSSSASASSKIDFQANISLDKEKNLNGEKGSSLFSDRLNRMQDALHEYTEKRQEEVYLGEKEQNFTNHLNAIPQKDDFLETRHIEDTLDHADLKIRDSSEEVSPLTIEDEEVFSSQRDIINHNSSLTEKLDDLNQTYYQLKDKHKRLSFQYETLREKFNKIESGSSPEQLKKAVKVAQFEKEKNLLLKQKWDETSTQLNKLKKQVSFLSTQLEEKEVLLRESQEYAQFAKREINHFSSEIDKRDQALISKQTAFDQKYKKLKEELELLKQESVESDLTKQKLEVTLRKREEEIELHKANYFETQSKIDQVTREIVQRESLVSKQLVEIETARTNLEKETRRLSTEKSHLKNLVTELNQRLLKVQISEENVSKQISEQNSYKRAFIHEKSELDTLREDVLKQKEEVDFAKKHLELKDSKINEIQSLLMNEKRNFDQERFSFEDSVKEKIKQENALMLKKDEILNQAENLSKSSRIVEQKEKMLKKLAQELSVKERSIEEGKLEVESKRNDLVKNKQEIDFASSKIKEQQLNINTIISTIQSDKNKLEEEKRKLNIAKGRIKDEFSNLNKEKKAFEDHQYKISESSLSPNIDQAENPKISLESNLVSQTDFTKNGITLPKSPKEDIFSNGTIDYKRDDFPSSGMLPDSYKKELNLTTESSKSFSSLPKEAIPPVVSTEERKSSRNSEVRQKLEDDNSPFQSSKYHFPPQAVKVDEQKATNFTDRIKSRTSEITPSKSYSPKLKDSSMALDKNKNHFNVAKSSKKRFWSAILIPLVLGAGSLGFFILNGVSKRSEDIVFHDESSEMKTLHNSFEIPSSQLKNVNYRVKQRKPHLPTNQVNRVEKIALKADYNSNLEDTFVPERFDSELEYDLDFLESYNEEKNIVVAVPRRNPVLSYEDENLASHIGILPSSFID